MRIAYRKNRFLPQVPAFTAIFVLGEKTGFPRVQAEHGRCFRPTKTLIARWTPKPLFPAEKTGADPGYADFGCRETAASSPAGPKQRDRPPENLLAATMP